MSAARSAAVLLVFCFVFVIPSRLKGQTQAPRLSFVDPTVTLQPNASEGTAMLALRAEGAKEGSASGHHNPSTPQDLGIPSPPVVAIKFGRPREASPSLGAGLWYVPITVRGLPPDTTQKRYARVRLDGTEEILDYTLTNHPSTAFSWTVRPPPSPWTVGADRVGSLEISVGPVPATDVRLVYSSLIEQSTKVPLGSNVIQLCQKATGACGTGLTLAPGTANRLFLRVSGQFTYPGTYQGAITVAAREKPDGDTLTLTVAISSFTRRFFGIALILIGVILALGVTVFARVCLDRARALAPAVVLRDQVQRLGTILDSAPPKFRGNFTQTRRALAGLLGQLSEANLDSHNYLPLCLPVPVPWGAPNAEAYKTFLEGLSEPMTLLSALVREGLEPAWKQWQEGMTDQQETAIEQALHTIDPLSDGQVPLAQARQQIQQALQQLRTDLHAAAVQRFGAGAAAPGLIGAAVTQPSYERLMLEIQRISWLFWIVWAFLTTLVGAAVLVFLNPGFGVPMDYVYCLLWGFGIPAAGQPITQLTATSVSGALGISVPKL